MNFSNPEVNAVFELLTQQPQGVVNRHYSGPLADINMACANQMFAEGSRHLKLREVKPARKKKDEETPQSPAGDEGAEN